MATIFRGGRFSPLLMAAPEAPAKSKSIVLMEHRDCSVMKKLSKKTLASFAKETRGATMIEYSILIGLITAVVIASIAIMSGRVAGWWQDLVTATAP